ncbi:hypothetical protein L6R52_38430, partial [Myxococcota bacterium]|nr:hypothetical protein [Myxococcota bacterium]
GVIAAAPDAATVVAIAEPAPDAGATASVDAGARDATKGTTKRRDTTGTVGSPGKDGVVTGPAKLEIDIGSGDATLFEVAKACKESVLRGDARLTVKGCPSGCAIVVDEEKCAGLTPAQNVAIGAGYREIVVVCGGKKRLQTQTKLEAGQETVLSCR